MPGQILVSWISWRMGIRKKQLVDSSSARLVRQFFPQLTDDLPECHSHPNCPWLLAVWFQVEAKPPFGLGLLGELSALPTHRAMTM